MTLFMIMVRWLRIHKLYSETKEVHKGAGCDYDYKKASFISIHNDAHKKNCQWL